MAQLRDSLIDGNLEVTGDIILKTNNNSVQGIHPETGVASEMLRMSGNGNTIIGGGGYENHNGNTHIYGEDVVNYVGSAGDVGFRPYYRAGDVIDFKVATSGYVTNSGKSVIFTIPITKPVIGSPNATVSSDNGFIFRQNGKYTHGCNGASSPTVYVKPTSYHVDSNFNSGFIITAIFDITTDVTNNSTIGITWDGKVTLY